MNMMNGLNNLLDNAEGMAAQAATTMREIGEMGNKLAYLQQMVSVVRKGGDPTQLMSAFIKQNPQAQQMMHVLQGKTPEGLKEYAENMAKSYGTDVNTVLKQLGMQG